MTVMRKSSRPASYCAAGTGVARLPGAVVLSIAVKPGDDAVVVRSMSPLLIMPGRCPKASARNFV